ncbi:MAG: thioredoxin domain-containing protein, partial [SAR324 cluster bacterium]|nr:thioredoxin domain-containing protein [SAR324 cluster bacterium]
MAEYTNQLIHEKSPYLLQHAHNPVDWHPWGEEAFDKARREDKLVLVSIGYATCHWCHVMERESFEDEALAAYLNDRFVAVKVDREERPDVDKIYMDSLHAMGIQGGWPLNMFTTPEGQPVAGGTYFPPDNRHGRMAFMQVLDKLHKLWRNDRFELMKNAKALTEYLQSRAQVTAEGGRPWTVEPIDAAVRQFAASFDSTHGGFQHNGPNKFPPSMGLMLLLRHHARTGDGHSLEMAGLTLRKMRGGGIYDQVGGGLSRYSTDHEWLVPHFEKMLYDNALFVQAAVETHQATGEGFYREVAEDVLTYVLRDMDSPEGGFFSAEDADSDGVEGKFYLWKTGEVTQVVGKKDAPAVLAYWDITDGGNYEGGASIPNTPRDAVQVAEELGMTEATLLKAVARGRKKMLDAKFERIRPLLDDKVLTSWNGLMISALAKAARAFGKADYLKPAIQAADFLLERL